MRDETSYIPLIKVEITKDMHQQARKYAKSKGYTFQGWVGQLIKAELQKAEEVKR